MVEHPTVNRKVTGSIPVKNGSGGGTAHGANSSYGEVVSFLLWEHESRVRFPIRTGGVCG